MRYWYRFLMTMSTYVITISLGWSWVLGLQFPFWKVCVIGLINYTLWVVSRNMEIKIFGRDGTP